RPLTLRLGERDRLRQIDVHRCWRRYLRSSLRVVCRAVPPDRGNMMPAIFRTSAMTEIDRPRLFSTSTDHATMGSLRRQRRAAQHACTSVQRTLPGPAFVIEVSRFRSELESSPGTSPRYDSTRCALENRVTSSMAVANLTAVTRLRMHSCASS